uniref:Ribosomal protein L2 n=1 Tax=Balamuthia mandrillaris TaxID=66527 RepID=A0A0K1HRJ7_9EUKA|nr:ribosomal protein L2 [Balamuthia mandrillaris]AKT94910.1 ribosomal protein L2 [Balamuthia mandrillaris]
MRNAMTVLAISCTANLLPFVCGLCLNDLMLSLWKKKSFKALSSRLHKSGGRSSSGRISVYHRGGGTISVTRHIDYLRYVYNLDGIVLRLEYEPGTGLLIAFVCFSNGVVCYIPAPSFLTVGMSIRNSWFLSSASSYGCAVPLINIPVGSFVHNIELSKLGGAQFSRAFGSYGRVMAKEAGGVVLKLKSGNFVKFGRYNFAVLGSLAHKFFHKKIHYKAGFFRLKGWRPVVRGVAMNPVDHPHGGGEGKSGAGRPSVSRWGWLTKNVKKKN